MTISILSRPATVPTVPTVATIYTHDLSGEAAAHLRSSVRTMRRAGQSAAAVSTWAASWAEGYRAFAAGTHLSQLTGSAFEGWQYAHGEDCWWHCQIVDAAQDSADACNYGWR